MILPLCFGCTTATQKENDFHLIIYAINNNNQIYTDCINQDDDLKVCDACIEMIDNYEREGIRYYDFSFRDCRDKEKEVFPCNSFITGVGVDSTGNLVRTIKMHKVIFESFYTKKEVEEMINKLPSKLRDGE